MHYLRLIALFNILPAVLFTMAPYPSLGQETADSVTVDSDFCARFGCGPTEPQLIGGLEALEALIRYPAQALQAEAQGQIFVLMTIDTTGAGRDAIVLRRVVNQAGRRLAEEDLPEGAFGLEAEALRVAALVRFIPASHVDGRKIEQGMALPVLFRLPGKR